MQEDLRANDGLQQLKSIRQIMDRSSRFISLSGLSGVAAGLFALAGAFIGRAMINDYYAQYEERGSYSGGDFQQLKIRLLLLAAGIFIAAFIASFLLTARKARRQGLPIWDHTSRRLAVNMIVPLLAGAGFIGGLLHYDAWIFVAPACLLFYGLALVNASKYTLTDIRYLGYCEIVLGVVSMYWPGYGIWFWAAGFGLLHIVYGVAMWYKYERNTNQ